MVRGCESATVRRWVRGFIALALLPLAVSPLAAQVPAFEAASVKPNRSGTPGMEIRVVPNGGFIGTNVPLRTLVRESFRVQDHQIVDLPSWADSERFDIVTRAPQTATPQQWQPMVQELLKERFSLTVRREMREMPIYIAERSRPDGTLGPRLQATAPAAAEYCASQQLPAGSRPPADPARICGMRQSIGTIQGGNSVLVPLFRFVSQQAGRAIVDRTGLTGNFDFELRWTPDQFANRETPAVVNGNTIDPGGPSLFTALQEQLGLKMNAQRGPVEMLVVERIERPTEN
jgi:uncharacterized protein (TIGR03435 family)